LIGSTVLQPIEHLTKMYTAVARATAAEPGAEH
jgi:hypothetical protein